MNLTLGKFRKVWEKNGKFFGEKCKMIPKINYEQDNLIALELNLKEARVLSYLEDFINSGRMAREQSFSNGKYRFYLIKYSKILKDNPILGIKTNRTLIDMFSKFEKKGLLIKHKTLKSNDLFIALNLSPLYNQSTEEPSNFKPGRDSNLQKYIKTDTAPFSEIGFNHKYFVYKNTKIKGSVFEKINLSYFNLEFKKRLKLLVSDLVYSYLKNLYLDTYKDKYLKFSFSLLKSVDLKLLEDNKFYIEQAICDSYLKIFTELIEPD